MRALAITGTVTAALMPSIIAGSLMRATPPSRRMSAGTRSSAITATAPASSAIFACSGVTTSMMTPPRSISARPRLTRAVPVVRSVMEQWYRPSRFIVRPLSPRERHGAMNRARGLLLVLLAGRLGRRRGRRRRGGGGRRGVGHVDGPVARQELHPGAAGSQQDGTAGGVDVVGGLGLVGAHPPAGAQRAVGEHPDVAFTDGLRIGLTAVGRELHHDVGRGDVAGSGDHRRGPVDR